ncbi:MAG TPA: iron chelate uptake ABC transporter family permease subunit [Symbiobacteriaceae bacterium]
MNDKAKLAILAALAIALIGLFLFTDLTGNVQYVLLRRFRKVWAIALTGATVSFATTVFQTLTNNRLLTPSIIGLDSLYLLLQTVVVFLFGGFALASMPREVQFLLSAGLMVFFASLLYRLLFRSHQQNLYMVLLVGIVCGVFFQSIASFMQKVMNPNEFLIVQDRMFASLNNPDTDVLLIATAVAALAVIASASNFKYLDVIALGRDQAISLGVPYEQAIRYLFLLVAVLTATATALAGPITFLGLLVANIARQWIQTYRHRYHLAGSTLLGVIALVGGQLVVERVFTFSTTLSVIINFVGGVYFLYLLVRENPT